MIGRDVCVERWCLAHSVNLIQEFLRCDIEQSTGRVGAIDVIPSQIQVVCRVFYSESPLPDGVKREQTFGKYMSAKLFFTWCENALMVRGVGDDPAI